ncbi:MAG: DUF2490 domain-containing protein, partial [Rickettsiales bacterium]|nr:DUF2490 domain-containing protein [Rickettsiales bacterium]
MRIKFALLIACLTSLLLAPHHAHAFNHYETLSISRPIWNDLSISGEIDHRFDGRRLTRRHFDVGLRHPIPFLGDGWSFRAHYRNVYWFKCGDTLLEKRPYAQIQKTFKTAENGAIPELKWGIRTRQEYRIRDNGNHTARNRSRIKVESQKTILDAKPFIASELFYD